MYISLYAEDITITLLYYWVDYHFIQEEMNLNQKARKILEKYLKKHWNSVYLGKADSDFSSIYCLWWYQLVIRYKYDILCKVNVYAW